MEHDEEGHPRKYIRWRDGIEAIANNVRPLDDLTALLQNELVQFWAVVAKKEPRKWLSRCRKRCAFVKGSPTALSSARRKKREDRSLPSDASFY